MFYQILGPTSTTGHGGGNRITNCTGSDESGGGRAASVSSEK